jgi:cytochrome c oxidase subunit 2
MTLPSFSVLHAAGVQSERIAELFWIYFYLSAAIFVLMTLAFVVSITRGRAADESTRVPLSKSVQRFRFRTVGVATALTVVTLVVMLLLSVVTSRALASLNTKDAVQVKVIAHKWWWEFTYPAAVAGTQFTTAYEMHIPVGRTVEVDLASSDVIHSFWVPTLHGKRDAIPSKHSSLFLRADRAGRYEGQCAEFCGIQHANMRFVVVAETDTEFKAWLAHSLTPAPVPDDSIQVRGRDVFLKSRCIVCHAIGGTDAFATVGPNLTHLASRGFIGMGTLQNTREHLAGWIVDPQSTKPGVIMPATPFDPDDLNALVTYLASLR